MDTSHINLIDLIGSDSVLKYVCGTNGGEYVGPCPWCGGTDRFHVQPHRPGGGRWFCRQCGEQGTNGPKWEDAIAYVVKRDGCSFREACITLGLETGSYRPNPRLNSHRKFTERPNAALSRDDWVAANDADWRVAASQFIEQASARLNRSEDGHPGREYLRKRGLFDTQVLAAHNVGYNAHEYRAMWGGTKVFIPARCIVFPYKDCLQRGCSSAGTSEETIKIKYRLIDRKEFGHARGSANGLYGISCLHSDMPVILVEAEICALSLWQAASGLVIPIATGSADGARLHSSIIRLAGVSRLILAFDDDKDGDVAAKWWQGIFPNAIRLRPTRHDINDMLQHGEDIRAWLSAVL